ncbi:unnamed protein product [Chironomus riparius]|uniref:Trissin n=1 Tax=Chironomus riparius TaxID=315576 RepID=A0A9N9RXI9_9DIPT|nr:unnamed protein product [Chironomus riparius]
MKSVPTMVLFCIYLLVWEYGFVSAMSCDSCGSECARACGTRHFRTCCFNYVRKRSTSMHPYPLNNANFDILYGPMMDYEIMRRSSEKSPKSLLGHENKNFENLMIENDESKNQQNFYKPWKESNNHMDNMILFNDYEQQNNRQGHEQKQPTTYDA